MLTTLCFDADDTLWHNERFFQMTQAHFATLLADYMESDDLADRLLAAEKRNLGRYGFGIKGFVLSMIETALDVTDRQVPGHVIAKIIAAGHDMLAHPIDLLPGVADTLAKLAPKYRLIVITKGDLLDQERKIAQSGLGEAFDGVEIVSDKTRDAYIDIFARHETSPETTLMAGNSMKSDVLPAIAAGAWGVYIPHGVNWKIEAADPPDDQEKYREAREFTELPKIIAAIEHSM
ncbi:HAD family hydrolase [uncultured Boseongicola sp.]|jgi:putative hydrolase of the HAD superfamily|uniref:HAD family hydrolase n=1 Tax=uncultured Boseongicola sp. TaxID=1648499 RepID=UPI00263928C5|nr:HAD family hydrolase [uncultured Boseongicola sp.]